jgi:hypothetical protein
MRKSVRHRHALLAQRSKSRARGRKPLRYIGTNLSDWTFGILSRSGVIGSTRWLTPGDSTPIYLTKAEQIVGPYSALLKFRNAFPDWYKALKQGGRVVEGTWEAHHIVEEQDLKILRQLGHAIPAYKLCPAVLLPEIAHQNLNRTLGRGSDRVVADLDNYRDAYKELGNYTGAGARRICDELVAICRLILK